MVVNKYLFLLLNSLNKDNYVLFIFLFPENLEKDKLYSINIYLYE